MSTVRPRSSEAAAEAAGQTVLVNPWLDLSDDPPWVLPVDRAAIERFNVTAASATKICLDALPEPFIGDPDAPVVLLNLNPGLDPEDPFVHTDSTRRRLIRANLAHEEIEYRFYYFDPAFDDTPGARWWRHHSPPWQPEGEARGSTMRS